MATLKTVIFQTFEFDVPWEQVRDCSLEVSVMDFDTIGRNELIGRLMLGGTVQYNTVRFKKNNSSWNRVRHAYVTYRTIMQTGRPSNQLFVTLYTLFIYPSVNNQMNRTLFEAHIIAYWFNMKYMQPLTLLHDSFFHMMYRPFHINYRTPMFACTGFL